MNSPTHCPTSEKLRSWCAGDVTEHDFSSVSQHIDDCDTCREFVLKADDREDSLARSLSRIPAGIWQEHVSRVHLLRPPRPDVLDTTMAFDELVGPYRVKSLIGRGGMANVYRAVDDRLGRTVALKVLSAASLQDSGLIERFVREWQAMGRMIDRRVVQPTNGGEHRGRLYLAMEYVDGVTLKDLTLHNGTLPVPMVAEIGFNSADGLSVVHHEQLIHRDVKPTNLMLDSRGNVRILDLGVAALVDDPEYRTVTQPGDFIGTFEYAAPEQIEDARNVQAASDQYSLACTLVYLLLGQPPFPKEQFETAKEVLKAHLIKEPPQVCKLRDDICPEFGAVLTRALSKSPSDRFASMREFAMALQPYANADGLETLVQAAIADKSAASLPPASLVSEWNVKDTVASGSDDRRITSGSLVTTAIAALFAVTSLVLFGLLFWQRTSPVSQPQVEPGPAAPSIRNLFVTAGPHRGFDPSDGHPVAPSEIVIDLETKAKEPRITHYFEARPRNQTVRIRSDRSNLWQSGNIEVRRFRSQPGTEDPLRTPNEVRHVMTLTADLPQVTFPIDHGTHKQGFFPTWMETDSLGRRRQTGTEGLKAHSFIFYCYPDLTFENATIESVVAKSSQQLQLSLDVFNRGTADAQPGHVGISFQRDAGAIANNVAQRIKYPAIAASKRHSLTIPVRVPRVKSSQILHLVFRVDVDDTTPKERDELPIGNWDYRTDDFIVLSYDQRHVPANNTGLFRLEVRE